MERLSPIYSNLSALVFRDSQDVDPERLFRVLEFLNALELPDRAYEQARGLEASDIAAMVDSWHPDVAEYLTSRHRSVRGSASQRVIDQLWDALVDIFSLAMAPVDKRLDYLQDLVVSMRGQTIVTLNYDDALEHVMGRAFTFRIDNAPYPQPLAQGIERKDVLRLIRLHGSLNWRRDNTTGSVDVIPVPTLSFRNDPGYWHGHTPGLIFGAGNKLRPDGPYLDLYQEFKMVLADARQVVVIGYSFRDAHVNEALRLWVLGQAKDDDLLRIGCLAGDAPTMVRAWAEERDLDLEVVSGLAEDVMSDLLAPRPRLMSRS
jgi:hypothetical protein